MTERPITITHDADCPVSSPTFKLPAKADGTVDEAAPSACTCDFMARLAAYLRPRCEACEE